MWQYNHTPEPDELMHFGIKGMQWGKRRYQNKDGSLTAAGKARYRYDFHAESEANLAEKKAAYKTAKKAYNKSFDKAYDRAIAAYSPSKKHRQANEERWKDVADKAETLRIAKSEYKTAKSDNKQARNKAMDKAINRAERRADFTDAAYMKVTQKKGKHYLTNMLSGAIGGSFVASSVNHKNGRSGKQAVRNILFGAGLGATTGAAKATIAIAKGNRIARKEYGV